MKEAIKIPEAEESNAIPTIPEKSTTVHLSVDKFEYTDYGITMKDLSEAKTVTRIEKTVRSSPEYRRYITYLKNELDLRKCAIMPGLDTDDAEFTLEFHHYPFTLFDICKIVGTYLLDSTGHTDAASVSTFQIAEAVMNEHFLGNVGLVPLSSTLHEIAHSGGIVIPLSKVNGNFTAFYLKYRKYIDEDLQSKVELAKTCTDADAIASINKAKLEKNVTRLDIEYDGFKDGSDA